MNCKEIEIIDTFVRNNITIFLVKCIVDDDFEFYMLKDKDGKYFAVNEDYNCLVEDVISRISIT